MDEIVGQLIHHLSGQWLSVVMAVFVLWLVVTRLVESHEALAKWLGPLGRRIQTAYHRRQERYRTDVADEAKTLALELIPKVVPSDYEVVKNQLRNVIFRVEDLELENQAMRSFIVLDEEWHFKWSLAMATAGLDLIAEGLPKRYAWTEFLANWRNGWRPQHGV